MPITLEKQLQWLEDASALQLLSQPYHGIEKEGLRVTRQGDMAMTPHPRGLGSALTHSKITTDYSEALLEFITPVYRRSDDALRDLAELHSFSYQQLDDELIWSGSMPCEIPSEEAIPVANYGSSNTGRLKHVYRQGLKFRYGKMMQTIAGIHYNFSIHDDIWQVLQPHFGASESLQEFRSERYFSLIRNFRRHSWLLLYLFGASPALSASFLKGKAHELESLDPDTLYLPYATSLRMSDLGYSNRAQSSLNICFNHLNTYVNSLYWAIHTPYSPYESIGIEVDSEYRQLNTNILQIENEYYSDIRPKRVTLPGEKPIHALMSRGVEYIEVRNTDINPLLPLGIDQTQADFLDLFLTFSLLGSSRLIKADECELILENQRRVVTEGRKPGLQIIRNGKEVEMKFWAERLLERMAPLAETMDRSDATPGTRFQDALKAQKEKISDPELTPSAQVLTAMKAEKLSHVEFILQQSERHKASFQQTPLSMERFTELSEAAARSLAEQAAVEAVPQQPFDQFLKEYLAS